MVQSHCHDLNVHCPCGFMCLHSQLLLMFGKVATTLGALLKKGTSQRVGLKTWWPSSTSQLALALSASPDGCSDPNQPPCLCLQSCPLLFDYCDKRL